VLIDLPLPALRSAEARADVQGVGGRVSMVRGSGTDLPFAAHSFDAISHTDTL
jgi:ubiquinone/menaquinone biosynthesis C-methylase UbiE